MARGMAPPPGVISRDEAIEQGYNKYYTGKPCPNGHDSPRYVSSYKCVECMSARGKRYYEENKEYFNQLSREYWFEHHEYNKQKLREYREENKEYLKEKQKEYWHNNRDELLLKQRQYWEENKEYIREINRLWVHENKEYKNAKARERTAKKKQAVPGWYEESRVVEFYRQCPEGYQVDHVIPLVNDNVCGLHCLDNLQYLTAEDNFSKGNKLLPEHAEHKGLWFE